jgi:hypothetical protein
LKGLSFSFLSLVVSVEVSMEEEWVMEEAEVMEAPEAAEWKCLYLLVCY